MNAFLFMYLRPYVFDPTTPSSTSRQRWIDFTAFLVKRDPRIRYLALAEKNKTMMMVSFLAG